MTQRQRAPVGADEVLVEPEGVNPNKYLTCENFNDLHKPQVGHPETSP